MDGSATSAEARAGGANTEWLKECHAAAAVSYGLHHSCQGRERASASVCHSTPACRDRAGGTPPPICVSDLQTMMTGRYVARSVYPHDVHAFLIVGSCALVVGVRTLDGAWKYRADSD